MAKQVSDKVEMESKEDDVVCIDLPAPDGWSKKFTPKKSGTPRRNEIVFVAPTGEGIKSKRQLDQYLKSHPDSPSASEFDWTTGDTPRRSARLSSKPRATDTPESGSSRKRQKKAGSKKEEEKKDENDGEGESAEDEAAANQLEDGKDVEMKDVDDVTGGRHSEVEKSEETAIEADSGKVVLLEQGNTEAQEKLDIPPVSENFSERGKEQAEENKVETDEKQTEARIPQDEVPRGREEQPVENKPEAESKLSDSELPTEINNALVEQPGETKDETGGKPAESEVQLEVPVPFINAFTEKDVNEATPANADKETNDSNQGEVDPENKDETVEVDTNGTKNLETAEQTENHPVDAAGAPHEPSAAVPISC